MKMWRVLVAMGLAMAAFTAIAQARDVHYRLSLSRQRLSANVIVPQSRVFYVARRVSAPAPAPTPTVQITDVHVGVKIVEQVATTTMQISLKNPTAGRIEAEVVMPVPDGAVVRGFTFEGKAKEPTAELLPKEEARRIYNQIVAKIRDPALLEFVGYSLIRSSVFPVEANATQRVQLTYEHLLPADGNRVDYVLPRTESIDYSVPWYVAASIKSRRPISTLYSPTHELIRQRVSKNAMRAEVAPASRKEPGAFRLSYLLEKNGVTASMLAYPDPKEGGGYFLMLAGLPADPPKAKTMKREVTLVFDRSGSMNGEKLKQVREAALQVIGGLDDGEAFNVIAYNETVDYLASRPVTKNDKTVAAAREYLKGVKARGGTNIHDALVEALRQKPTPDTLPIVLFLTDGLPTVGETSEKAIRELVEKANPHKRRVFTFGVGPDVNTALLERVALETRATSTFVLPKEDVEVKVASVFRRLSGPVLAEPKLAATTEHGEPVAGRVHEILPDKLPDLFSGDQLVVLGRYKGEKPVHFRLSGNYLGKRRTFRFTFQLDKATTKNAFVPRLWASRKIGVLIDAIRALGADAGPAHAGSRPPDDPRLKELVDEIVRLSREFGILTEYTAFLAREGTDLSRHADVLATAHDNFVNRAIGGRVGLPGYNQDNNRARYRAQSKLNIRNDYLDANLQRVQITGVQQINDRAFFRRGKTWIDSRLLDEGKQDADVVIQGGSKEFKELVEKLQKEGRAGSVSLKGDVLLKMEDKKVRVSW
jgi:Ca-activated chloride channel family protein